MIANGLKRIPLSRPDVTTQEIAQILEVLSTPQLSLGPKLLEFERKFADYIGVRYAIAVNSGTSALHLAIKGLNIGERDAVITTPFSFIASANCALFEKATPIFVDIDASTFNINVDEIEDYLGSRCYQNRQGEVIDLRSGKQVKAILPVHVFGLSCQMDRLMELARRYGLFVIEDACEAIGAEFDGKKVGSFGHAATFAFYPNKQITTGEGGMVLTDDRDLMQLCRSLRNQGRDEDGGWLAHRRLGYNYRLSEVNCVLGIGQLERIDEILSKRARIAEMYIDKLRDLVTIQKADIATRRSWFCFVCCLAEAMSRSERDRILKHLSHRGIGCSNYFPPIHLQPFYVDMFGYEEGDFPVTESISARTIALPFYNNLEEADIAYVVDCLREILEDHKIAPHAHQFVRIGHPVSLQSQEYAQH